MLPDELEFNAIIVSQALPYFKPISDKISGFCSGLCMRVSLRRARHSQAPRIAQNTRTPLLPIWFDTRMRIHL